MDTYKGGAAILVSESGKEGRETLQGNCTHAVLQLRSVFFCSALAKEGRSLLIDSLALLSVFSGSFLLWCSGFLLWCSGF